jgi:hypothetical protein
LVSDCGRSATGQYREPPLPLTKTPSGTPPVDGGGDGGGDGVVVV